MPATLCRAAGISLSLALKFGQARALPLAAAATAVLVLFLLPGGRPRRFTVTSDIHAGGLPRRRTRPRASRSRLRIASSSCNRSSFNSIRIFYYTIALNIASRYFAAIHSPHLFQYQKGTQVVQETKYLTVRITSTHD
jgi:hypothetical protein